MANLHNYHGRYCEAEFESTFLSYLEEAGWSYLAGSSLPRSSMRDVLYTDDMEFFLNRTNPDLTADEIQQIMTPCALRVRKMILPRCIRCTTGWVNGIQFNPAGRSSQNGQFD